MSLTIGEQAESFIELPSNKGSLSRKIADEVANAFAAPPNEVV